MDFRIFYNPISSAASIYLRLIREDNRVQQNSNYSGGEEMIVDCMTVLVRH